MKQSIKPKNNFSAIDILKGIIIKTLNKKGLENRYIWKHILHTLEKIGISQITCSIIHRFHVVCKYFLSATLFCVKSLTFS